MPTFQTSSPSSPDWIVLCSLTFAQMAQQSRLPLPRVPDGELSVHPAAGECFVPALSQELKGEEQERVQQSPSTRGFLSVAALRFG